MASELIFSSEAQQAWVAFIKATSKPARTPHFPQLLSSGEWIPWESSPELSEDEPNSVEQPQQVQPIGAETTTHLSLQHDPLPTGQIRLLRLDKVYTNQQTNTLHGFEIISVPLRTAPTYSALSYAWGDMRICTAIFFNDSISASCSFRVTEDLATCFHSILQSQNIETPSYLWVDQICINQADMDERNSQVRCMVDIYRNASQVIAWLGQESDDKSSLQHIIDEDIKPGPIEEIDGISLGDLMKRMSVFDRAYFTRLWIFQELAVAKHVGFLFGTSLYTWQELDESQAKFSTWVLQHPSRFVFAHHLNGASFFELQHAKESIMQTDTIDFTRMLQNMALNQKCRDPRDYVFGLLGYAGYMFPADFVDYRKSTKEVFRDTARLIIERSKDLHILRHAPPRQDPKQLDWSPYWGAHVQVFTEDNTFAACKGRSYVPRPVENKAKFLVRGKIVGSVSTVVPGKPMFSKFMPENALSGVINIRDLCREIHGRILEEYKDIQVKQHMWSEIINNVIDTVFWHDKDGRAPVELGGITVEEVYDTLLTLEHVEEAVPDDSRQQRLVVATSQVRSAFRNIAVLQDGRLTSVRADAVEPEDYVVILHGLKVPCILRKAEGKDEWIFRGDAFIKGIMRGEGVTWTEEEADTFILV